MMRGDGRADEGQARVADAIDRNSPVPYYEQLSQVLEEQIRSGRVARGERLPSENELGSVYGLSRATVRQSLQLLESRGVAQRIANRGVFAVDPTTRTSGWLIQETEGFLDSAVGHQNRSVSTHVVRSGYAVLPAEACRELELPEGTRGFELVRLRTLDGVPAVFSVNHSPPEVAAVVAAASDVLSGAASLTQLLESAGYVAGGGHRTIRAASPGREVARHLGVKGSVPVLHVSSVSWTTSGARYDHYDTWVRSDGVPLEVNVSSVELARHA
jgi:GntR family transcriptional regulator